MSDNSNQQDLNSAKKDKEKNFTSKPCQGKGSSIEPCPKPDKFKIVQLVEVVVHEGKETTRPWKERKQYIHCDPKLDPKNPHPEYGRCIRLKAQVKWESGSSPKQPVGRTIKWSFDRGAKNQKKLTGEDKEGFNKKGGPEKVETITDSNGWTQVVKFYLSDPVDQWKSLIPYALPKRKKRLSQYDRDTFTITAEDENQNKLTTGILTVIGLIDWLPGFPSLKDPDIPTLKVLSSIPIGIVIHSGGGGANVAEYLSGQDLKERKKVIEKWETDEKTKKKTPVYKKDKTGKVITVPAPRRVSAHFAWSSKGKFMQMVDLDLVARHAGELRSHNWWGIEMSGPPRDWDKRTQEELDDFGRLLKKDSGFLHLASGGHLKHFCLHRDIELNREDPGPDSVGSGSSKDNIASVTGLVWGMPPDGKPGKTVRQLKAEKEAKEKKKKNKNK
jgi:hypothetical protein